MDLTKETLFDTIGYIQRAVAELEACLQAIGDQVPDDGEQVLSAEDERAKLRQQARGKPRDPSTVDGTVSDAHRRDRNRQQLRSNVR